MKKLLRFFLFGLSVAVFSSCNRSDQPVIYPYSQWTIGLSGHHLSWQYPTDLEMNHSFIRHPEAEDWDEWYNSLVRYRDEVKAQIGRTPPVIRWNLAEAGKARIHFDKIGYDQELVPGEIISIEGTLVGARGSFHVYATYDLKTKGEELSYVVRKQIHGPDTLELSGTGADLSFELQTTVPDFDPSAYALSPILWIEAARVPDQANEKEQSAGSIGAGGTAKDQKTLSGHETPGDDSGSDYQDIYEVRLTIPGNRTRHAYLDRVEHMIEAQAKNNALQVHEQFDWMHDNFVMGFAFTWDTDFWDPVAGEYTVDQFCEKMEREFGGFQSVVLWHSYPNIGIDDKNQFDMFEAMPGGLQGLREVTKTFHEHGVKVFITYNPWDLDTRRPDQHDNMELARIVSEINADGIYLDTWKSSCGVISIFSADKFMREAVADLGLDVAFSTEIHPEFKDLIGYNALTCSWGQEIAPFNYTDLSVVKWMMPQHKQHYIKRMNKDRSRELTHAWINGQGIQGWENIFGTMNPWNATDRRTLRKMNVIWQSFGRLYASENWLPLLPLENNKGLMSVWSVGGQRIINVVNTAENEIATISLNEELGDSLFYYDLWSGAELYPDPESGMVSFTVKDFGCLLISDHNPNGVKVLMSAQQEEDNRILPDPANDPHTREWSIKHPMEAAYTIGRPDTDKRPDQATTAGPSLENDPGHAAAQFLELRSGKYTIETSHIWREGHCYPNADARDNHDLDISRENGTQMIHHSHTEQFNNFAIMPEVVTNRQFAAFLEASGYVPRFPENFLRHWEDGTCPDSLLDKPVVFVGLEDARAYADWSGMQLPTEWQWQLSREIHGEAFVINEVFEWNESERYDGHNRFVTLRGGCADWTMPSSWWYLPSAPRGEPVGGPQRYDSHVKYFLMYPGLDRARTIGFRCMKEM